MVDNAATTTKFLRFLRFALEVLRLSSWRRGLTLSPYQDVICCSRTIKTLSSIIKARRLYFPNTDEERKCVWLKLALTNQRRMCGTMARWKSIIWSVKWLSDREDKIYVWTSCIRFYFLVVNKTNKSGFSYFELCKNINILCLDGVTGFK